MNEPLMIALLKQILTTLATPPSNAMEQLLHDNLAQLFKSIMRVFRNQAAIEAALVDVLARLQREAQEQGFEATPATAS